MSTGGEFEDRSLLRSNSSVSNGDLERGGSQSPPGKNISSKNKGCLPSDLLKWLDRRLSGSDRRLSINLRSERDHHRVPSPSSTSISNNFVSADTHSGDDSLGNSAQPEWALLLIGCLLGVATGLCVAAFNRGTASAPGIWLLAQLSAAKVVATTLCKGSGLVGGLYAPSLMIGAAVGAVFGGFAGELINSAILGNATIAEPQAYALVGMAATLASVCSVPLTSVLLLFELTRDYRMLLPLMGAVGLVIWVPSVTTQQKETEVLDTKHSPLSYSILSPSEDKSEDTRRITGERDDIELSIIGNASKYQPTDVEILLDNLKVSQAMSDNYLKFSPSQSLREALNCMCDGQQNCALVVDADDYLEGILTYGDIKRWLFKRSGDPSSWSTMDVDTCNVSSMFTRGISYRGRERGLLTCYPGTDLAMAKQLMEAKGIKQLPGVKLLENALREKRCRVVAVLYYDSIWICLRDVINHMKSVNQKQEDDSRMIVINGHR